MRASVLAAVVALAGGLALLPACGRKTAVRPPEYVAPAAVRELDAANTTAGVRLEWPRPRETADGKTLFDLDAFVVERALPGEPFAFLARVPVLDRDRLRQQRRFDYVDEDTTPGEAYRYRVIALTVDGYLSVPSPVADVVRVIPSPTPTDAPTPTVTPLP